MIGDAAVLYLEPYGGDYFSSVLIGIAFESYLWIGLRSFSDSIRRGQIGSVSTLLGGVLYPITVLPIWLQIFSYLLPITYSLRGMRHALLQGYSLAALSLDILALAMFSVVLLPQY
jgi:ABC-type multidrug transport system permease subunit